MTELVGAEPAELAELLGDDYTLGGEIGRGMFGVVWAARHRRLERDVAVKQFAGPMATEREYASRFEREARVLAQLDHPHVVTVYDYRERGALRVLIMERLSGGTFADRRAGMSLESMLASIMAAASALHHVHEHGILHRDVKPENMMFDGRGTLKVSDFGLARGDVAAVTAVDLSQAGQFFGTPAFAAPEQAAEMLGSDWPAVSEASDQYALGAVLYEALTGELTHDPSGGRLALLARRMQEHARPLRAAAPEVPVEIDEVVHRALARDPSGRFDDLERFAVALAEATTNALGRDWLARSEVRIREAGPIRDAAGGQRQPPPVAPAPAGPAPPPPIDPTPRRAQPDPGDPGPEELGVGSEPQPPPPARPSRWRRWAVLGAAATLAAVVAVFILLRDDPDGIAIDTAAADAPETVGLTERWRFITDDDIVGSPVAVADGIVVGSSDGLLYVIDASGDERWRFATGDAIRGSPAVDGDVVFVGSDDGFVYALDVAQEQELWSEEIGFTVVSSPAVASGTLVVGADRLYAYDAVAGGEPLWTYDAGGSIVSSPAIDGDTVVVGSNDGSVHAVTLTEGEPRWTVATGDEVRSSPRVSDGVAYVGSNSGSLYAIALETGDLLWEQDLSSPVKSSPAIVDGVVFVGTDAGELVARAADDGTEVWTAVLGGRVDSSPLVVGDLVVVGNTDGNVYVLAGDDGAVVAERATAGAIISSPARFGELVVVGSFDNRLYALDGLGAA